MDNRRTFIGGCLALLGLGATVKATENDDFCDCKGTCRGHFKNKQLKVKTKFECGQYVKAIEYSEELTTPLKVIGVSITHGINYDPRSGAISYICTDGTGSKNTWNSWWFSEDQLELVS